MSSIGSLAAYELPQIFVRPALGACRPFNTSLDCIFYNAPALEQALRDHGGEIVTSEPGNAPTSKGEINLSAETDPEGSLLVINPAPPPYGTFGRTSPPSSLIRRLRPSR
jgi:hypothetical protein